jgi:hypothetical protein
LEKLDEYMPVLSKKFDIKGTDLVLGHANHASDDGYLFLNSSLLENSLKRSNKWPEAKKSNNITLYNDLITIQWI